MKPLLVLMLSLLWLVLPMPVLAEGEPQLSITNMPPEFVVSWPDLPSWVLEQSPHLQAPIPWTLVAPESYQAAGLFRFVRLSSVESNRFFRLRKEATLSVPGLAGYFPLEEGSGETSSDGSGPGTALLLENISWSSGRIGLGGLQFNGRRDEHASRAWVSNNNYRVLPASGGPFSVSLWFNPDDLDVGWRGLAGNDAAASNGWHVALNSTGPGTNFIVFAANSSLSVTGRMLLLPGQWHQLTVTHDGVQGSVYVDSALLGGSPGIIATHAGPIYFGGGFGGFNSFLGRIDDIRIYTNCLTQEDISLTGWWRFDENTALYAADSSIQGHPAQLSSSLAWAVGHSGSGVLLGSNQIVINNSDYSVLPASGGSFSVSFWLQPQALRSGSGLMNCGTDNLNGWSLSVESEAIETLLHFCSTNRGGTLDLLAALPLAESVWTKVDITFNGGIATLYANGKKIKESSGGIRGSRSPLIIGAVPGMQSFSGVIDEVKIFNRERGSAEIGPVAATMWETALMNSATNLQLQGDGPAGRQLTYELVPVITPTNGTVEISANSGVITYTAGGRKGPDAFTYTVSDGEFTTEPAIVTISVVEPHWLATNGGSLQPLDGSSLEHAWLAGGADALDAIWKTNKYYDCFFYGAGEFQTRGYKGLERGTANPGCKHIGSGVSGPSVTTLKLVDVWSTWSEGIFFATLDGVAVCDGFEVRHMVLDCNATNVPKYVQGEPIWIRIPLSTTGRVETATLGWDGSPVYGNTYWWSGRAREFSVCTSLNSANGLVTNCTTLISTGQVDVVTVGRNADELILQLTRRDYGTDFYGLREIEVSGGTVSVPTATRSDGGESRLNAQYSILAAVDNNPGTFWASGAENDVRITLPLEHNTEVSQINLQWNCKNVVGTGRFGPAASYVIRARDENTGQYLDVPFTTSGRAGNGIETARFGVVDSTTVVRTDKLVVELTAKEAGIDFYSLKEVSLQVNTAPVKMRLPSAFNTLTWGNYSVLRAFDRNPSTQWASDGQGMVGALDLAGNNLRFQDLRVIGFGTKATRECFPLGIYSHWSGQPKHLGNVVVEDCVFTDPAPSSPDGITTVLVAGAPPDSLTNAVVRRCTVEGLKNHFTYSQAFTATHVENCLVTDCQRAIYFEPNPGIWDNIGEPVLIRSNRFMNVDNGVHMLLYPAAHFDSLTLYGNEMILSGAAGWGFGECDTCLGGESGSLTNLTALNNIVRYADWVQRPERIDGGLAYANVRNAVFGNNILGLGTTSSLRVRQYPSGLIAEPIETEDCDHPGPFPAGGTRYPASLNSLLPGYRRAWFGNRNLSGTNLEIRFSNFGLDGPALEQQWAE
jgi:hypothetical protein